MSLNLDANKLVLSDSGVDNYFWPFSIVQLNGIRDELMLLIPSIIRDYYPDDIQGYSIIGVENFILREMMCLSHAILLLQNCTSLGVDIRAGSNNRLITLAATEKEIRFPHWIEIFMKLYPSEPFYYDLVRCLKDQLLNSSLNRKYFNKKKFDYGTICVSQSKLIEKNKFSINDFTFVPLKLWFNPVTDDDIRLTAKEVSQWPIINSLLNGYENLMANLEYDVSITFRNYLKECLIKSLSVSCFRFRNIIDNKKEKIPEKLWTGTGGQPYSRVLRTAVHANGGRITGHDHAYGMSIWKKNAKSIHDLEQCDKFVTFTKAGAKLLEKSINVEHIVERSVPLINSVPVEIEPNNNVTLNRANKISKIIYPMDVYHGDEYYTFGGVSDLTIIDWQARLTAFLKRKNIHAGLKPHPQSEIKNDYFTRNSNVHILKNNFTTYLSDYDAVIIDNPYSTTFGATIKSSLPMIFIDFGYSEMWPEAKNWLKKRCSIVNAKFNSENRIHIDWQELEQALEDCLELRDKNFEKLYLANIDI